MLVMDHDFPVCVNGAVDTVCTMGNVGVSYISGALCEELGIQPSSLKSSTAYRTTFPGERLRRMSIIPTLKVKFASGFEVEHGPWVVDDAALVPMQTGMDFIESVGGMSCSSRGVVFSSNPNVAEVPTNSNSNSSRNPRLLAMHAPKAGAIDKCLACSHVVKGMKGCTRCKAAGRGVCPIDVRYCSHECQKSDWPRRTFLPAPSPLPAADPPSMPSTSTSLTELLLAGDGR
jgi:hypothetical protein